MAEPRFSIEKVVERRGSVSGALAVTASGQGDPGFLNTLLAAPLPPSDVEFGNVELRGEAGKSVILGSGKTKAEFKASAGAHGRFGAYAEGADVLKALKLKADEIGGLSLPSELVVVMECSTGGMKQPSVAASRSRARLRPASRGKGDVRPATSCSAISRAI